MLLPFDRRQAMFPIDHSMNGQFRTIAVSLLVPIGSNCLSEFVKFCPNGGFAADLPLDLVEWAARDLHKQAPVRGVLDEAASSSTAVSISPSVTFQFPARPGFCRELPLTLIQPATGRPTPPDVCSSPLPAYRSVRSPSGGGESRDQRESCEAAARRLHQGQARTHRRSRAR